MKPDVVELLLTHGSPVEAVNHVRVRVVPFAQYAICVKVHGGLKQNGYTMLHWAAQEGDVRTMALLLERGADIAARSRVSIIANLPLL
jgi:hypothetical protein